VGQANNGWCKLGKHPDKKALTWFDHQQVDALIRDSWGDVGHLTVFVRRDDAVADHRWSATVVDHENRALVTAHAPTKSGADERAIDALKALGHSTTGYGSKAGKSVRPEN
jgi:conjugal transfer/entry exclusion protein